MQVNLVNEVDCTSTVIYLNLGSKGILLGWENKIAKQNVMADHHFLKKLKRQ